MIFYKGKINISIKRMFLVFILTSVLFYSFNSLSNQSKHTNSSFGIDKQIQTQAREFIDPKKELGIESTFGPYYLVWNETLWDESSTSSWSPYLQAGSDYIYTWSSSDDWFSFREEGAAFDEPFDIDTSVYRTVDFRWDTVDIHAKIEFDIRFYSWGAPGGFENSWCTWQVGDSDFPDYGSSNIDDVVSEGLAGGNPSYTIYQVNTGVWTDTNILYNIPTMNLGGMHWFSIGTIGEVREDLPMAYERFECCISNIRIFDVQFRRYFTISDFSGQGGDTIFLDGDGFQRYSTITAVWLGDQKISSEYLVGDTYIPANGEIANDFGFRIPSNIIGTYDNISIETTYQKSTFNASTGFPGFTVNQGLEIQNNDDLALFSSKGSGSASNPYVLENLTYNLNGFERNAILINNTDDYFVLNNSAISNTSTGYHGIILNNVTNGLIHNNTIFNCKGDGIQLRDSSNCNVTENRIFNNSYSGVVLFDGSLNNDILNNNISYNFGNGLEMNRNSTGCSSNDVKENLIENNGLYGINTTGTVNTYYRNLVWINTNGNIWDGGTSETWDENLVDENGDYDSDDLLNRNEVYNNTDPFLADTDLDGIPDGWEMENFLDPLNTSDAIDDFDLDLLINIYEYFNGTDPNDWDTDDDSLSDYIEINTLGTSPTSDDTDSDNITDDEEIILGSDNYITNPLVADTDSDGLIDGEETTLGDDGFLTDPTDADSDDDDLTDGEEYLAGTDPLDADSDDDGLFDNVEITLGTDPNDVDSDDDLLDDYAEVFDFGTDPNDSDTDDDTIDDFEETIPGTDGWITDPTEADTDGDGINDPIEIAQGTDPTDPNDPSTTPPTSTTSNQGFSAGLLFAFSSITLITLTLTFKRLRNKSN